MSCMSVAGVLHICRGEKVQCMSVAGVLDICRGEQV